MRDAYRRLVAQGWTDALRALHPDERIYTFWKYFRNAFARDAGLRIDHLLLSPIPCRAAWLPPGSTAMCGPAKASDHAPVWIELADAKDAAGAAAEEGLIRLTLRLIDVAKASREIPFSRAIDVQAGPFSPI